MISALVALIAIPSSLAFLTYQAGTATNKMGVGHDNVTVTEPGVNPSDVPLGPNTKPVQLTYTNDGSTKQVPGVARVTFVPTMVTVDGTTDTQAMTDANFQSMPASVTDTAPPGGYFSSDGQQYNGSNSPDEIILGDLILYLNPDWQADWIYQNGYFYYNKVLNPGDTTPTLLEGVDYVQGTDTSLYANDTLHVTVMSDILQANTWLAGTPPTLTSAPEQAGWGVTVSSDEKTVVSTL